MRYVGYVRISSEDQHGNYSLTAQRHAIETWIARRPVQYAGSLMRIYQDECFTGTTDERPAFQQMLRDARSGKFDALVVHKWDRLARSRLDAIRYKALMGRECALKLFAVEGISEDEDEFVGMLFEAMIEVWSEFYSRNLSRETRKGKHEKAREGKHNNQPPFGAAITPDGILIPDQKELPGLMLALETYAEGCHSDNRVAEVLDHAGCRTKQGKRFTGEMVRHMLQNRTYLGQVRYQAYRKHGDGSRDKSVKTEWFKGQHEPMVPVELFERCQEVRRQRRRYRRNSPQFLICPLSGLLYCHHCGRRMRAQKSPTGRRYYHCISECAECAHQMIPAAVLEQQVFELLAGLDLPQDWRVRKQGVASDWAQTTERARELQGSIERLDFRWDMGFIEKGDYLAKRTALQQQLEKNQPIAEQELTDAENVLPRFREDWQSGNAAKRKLLLHTILEAVSVSGREVQALTLHPPFAYLVHVANNGVVDTEGRMVVKLSETSNAVSRAVA